MKKRIKARSVLPPHPVLIVSSYGEDGLPNMMAASWGGICCSEPPCVAVSLRKATASYHNIVRNGAFTVGIPTENQVVEADYVGIVSSRDADKFAVTGFHALRSESVNAPYAEEIPVTLECKLIHTLDLGLHTQFVGEIVSILADDAVLTSDDKPDLEKIRPFVYGGMGSPFYYGMGEKLGRAFSIGSQLKDGKK